MTILDIKEKATIEARSLIAGEKVIDEVFLMNLIDTLEFMCVWSLKNKDSFIDIDDYD